MAAQVKRDYRRAALDAKTRALLGYAIQITRDPQSASAATIEGLRQAGWTDEEILTATHIIGFFNYYVRLADPLGVEPEEFMRGQEIHYQKKNSS